MQDRKDRKVRALAVALVTNCTRVEEYGRTWAVRPLEDVAHQLGISPGEVESQMPWLDAAEERLIGVEKVDGAWRTFVSVGNPMLELQVRMLNPNWEDCHAE